MFAIIQEANLRGIIMETVRCKQGHTWTTDDQETVAMCPACGGAPVLGAPAMALADNPEQTIGEGSLIRPHSQQEFTVQLSGATEDDGESPEDSDRTIDGQTDQPAAGPDEPETTLGVGAVDDQSREEAHDQTIDVDRQGTRRSAGRTNHRFASGGDRPGGEGRGNDRRGGKCLCPKG